MNAPVRELSSHFDIVAFPSNQFGLQEPGTGAEILNGLCYVRPGNGFIPEFTLATKGDVNGPNEQPLFTYLKSACGPTSNKIGKRLDLYWDPIMVNDITWNFEKFLVDASGKVRYRFHSTTPVRTAVQYARALIAEKKLAPKSGHQRSNKVLDEVTRELQSFLDGY